MTELHHHETIGHYGPRSAAYVTSAVHAAGPDLDQIEGALAARFFPRVLDLGCGGGHVSYRAAPHVGAVVACDLTPQMIAAVERAAAERGLSNISGVVAAAEALPFPDGHFDAILCRFTAHHWADLHTGLAEARRVARTGALLVFIDTVAPDIRAADTHLQTIEYLRDPSHVRNYTQGELEAALVQAGFAIDTMTRRPLRMGFVEWIERTHGPTEKQAILRQLQREAGTDVRGRLMIEPDGSFVLEAATFMGAAQ
ncbi:class I SAM-dependent methyltransferase [Sphingobium sp. HBC34]|uniref:Class I SAM-dependent methyltransferase n=1 Tax=Sphingobium cyanobacteriorum TaxID=3063954 RepID=A0ABT8ZQ00_9SPHN|nr:class I SAM-dependent methyltransferase [Sphingobium sp. HBC34]MDO7836272.1 class I SAM-dependent methyltransferase [Sphingobium sp. HBC34]